MLIHVSETPCDSLDKAFFVKLDSVPRVGDKIWHDGTVEYIVDEVVWFTGKTSGSLAEVHLRVKRLTQH